MTSHRRRVPTRFLINQCQIITFLILKYDIIENSRIVLRGIVLPVQVGGLLGGAGMLAPLSNYWGGACPPPLFLRLCSKPSYAYVMLRQHVSEIIRITHILFYNIISRPIHESFINIIVVWKIFMEQKFEGHRF